MIRGVLFDMDGVLLDSEGVSRTLTKEYCESIGHPITDVFYRRLMGVTRETSERVLKTGLTPDFDFAAYSDFLWTSLQRMVRAGQVPLMEGAEECLAALKARNIRIALASSTRRDVVEERIAWIPAMRNVFDAMVLGQEAGASKPDPAIYIAAARALGLRPEECAGVEDSGAGLRSVRASGAYSVMIPDLLPYSEDLEPYVDSCLPSLRALVPLIDRLNGKEPE